MSVVDILLCLTFGTEKLIGENKFRINIFEIKNSIILLQIKEITARLM